MMSGEMKQRPAYFVQSPSNHDADDHSPVGSPVYPTRNHHQQRDSTSTYQFSGNLVQNTRPYVGYTSLQARQGHEYDEEDEMDGSDRNKGCSKIRLYFCMFLLFIVLFSMFCLILWGASKSYRPIISLKGMVFENLDVQAGSDDTGVATDMVTLNSTVKIFYRNPATFFTVHVSASPLEISFSQLRLAHGQMKRFSQKRKSQRTFETVVGGNQVPLYGGIPAIVGSKRKPEEISVPLNLTFTVRSTAHILGQLVKSRFRSNIRCLVILQGGKLGKSTDLSKSCSYD